MSFPHTHASVKEPEILIDSEIQILLTKLKLLNPRDYMMIDLCLCTGLRNEELCSLTIECVESFEIITYILALPGTIAKGGFPRDIPLNPDIREHLQNFLSWKIANDEKVSPESFLFVSKFTHNKLSPRDFQRILKSVSKKSIGRHINPHVLRHTFATRLLKVSNLRIVQKVLGHKSILTTQIYTHPSNDDVSEAVNNLVTLND